MLPQLNTNFKHGKTYRPNEEEMQLARKILSRELAEYDQLDKHTAHDAINILKMKAVNKQHN